MKKYSFIKTVAVAAAMLGTVVPATARAASPSMFSTRIELNGSVLSRPTAFVANQTTYMPIYYVQQLIDKLGIHNSWNGGSTPQTWTFDTNKSVSLNIVDKSGTVDVLINGKTVEHNVDRFVATDPSTGKGTTFVPIWYIQQILHALGIQNQWNGNSGVKTWSMTSGISSAPTPPAPPAPPN